MSALKRGLVWLHRIEDAVLTLLVLALVVLAGGQILLRNVFDTGLSWADPLLRAFVLWSAMLGALIAAREDHHIGIDFIARFARGTARRIARILALGGAAVLCAAMAWHSVGLVAIDYAGNTAGAAGIPSWLLESVLPVGFALMALRFAIRACMPPPEPEVSPVVVPETHV